MMLNNRDPNFRDIKLILIPANIHVHDNAGRIIAKCYKVAEQLDCPCLWTGE